MDEDRIPEGELYQIQQIRELEEEELQVEEVDSLDSSSDDDDSLPQASGREVTFNATLASLHTYLGEVEDTQNRLAFLDGGTTFSLPLFYLEGVVLFPGATLPLRVVESNLITVIERAMGPSDAPYTIGVVRVYRDLDNRCLRFANVGTTAEIRQYRRLEDGSVNVVTRGQQRFRVRRRWMDVDGAPCGEIQIIQEDLPLRAPRDAFGPLAPLRESSGTNIFKLRASNTSQRDGSEGNDSDTGSEGSFESELSLTEMRLHQSALASSYGSDVELPVDNDEEGDPNANMGTERKPTKRRPSKGKERRKDWMTGQIKKSRKVSSSYWPHWVYQMYDSFHLAQRLSDMWKHIIGTPSMECYVRQPDILSFHVASKIPVSESTRQELLEIDGISYRIRREIELLESFDCVRCKKCKFLIARRSDMLIMSSEGPLSAYVNPHGVVHETMTFLKASGLTLVGRPDTRCSWFPGYAWTIADCENCRTHIGWLYTATKKELKPKSFWGIRSCQVAEV